MPVTAGRCLDVARRRSGLDVFNLPVFRVLEAGGTRCLQMAIGTSNRIHTTGV